MVLVLTKYGELTLVLMLTICVEMWAGLVVMIVTMRSGTLVPDCIGGGEEETIRLKYSCILNKSEEACQGRAGVMNFLLFRSLQQYLVQRYAFC